MDTDEEFARFVAGRARALRRTAFLMCGDWQVAEDLVQETFVRLYAAWGRLARRGELDAYARRTLLRLYIDERRRRRSTEVVVARVADHLPAVGAGPDDRLDLLAALGALPRRQRAVLVMRFWEDLDVATVALAMDCPEGTVKSLTSRGLDALRQELERRGLSPLRGEERR